MNDYTLGLSTLPPEMAERIRQFVGPTLEGLGFPGIAQSTEYPKGGFCKLRERDRALARRVSEVVRTLRPEYVEWEDPLAALTDYDLYIVHLYNAGFSTRVVGESIGYSNESIRAYVTIIGNLFPDSVPIHRVTGLPSPERKAELDRHRHLLLT